MNTIWHDRVRRATAAGSLVLAVVVFPLCLHGSARASVEAPAR